MRAAPAELDTFLKAYDRETARLSLATRKAVLAVAPAASEWIFKAVYPKKRRPLIT